MLNALILARNEAQRIAATVQSAAAACERVLVVACGCADGTAEVARGAGAQVLEIPWEDDFASARNAGLDAIGDGAVLALDCDELLPAAQVPLLRGLAERARTQAFAVTVRTWGERPNRRGWLAAPADGGRLPAAGFVPERQLRLFPARAELRYAGAWAEGLPAGLAAGPCALVLDHLRLLLGRPPAPLPPARKAALLERARSAETGLPGLLRIARQLQEAQELAAAEGLLLYVQRRAPGDARLGAALGDLYLSTGSWKLALRQYRKAVATDPTDPWSYIGLAYARLADGDPRGSLKAGKAALALEPTAPEAFRLVALSLGATGKVRAGMEAIRRALELAPRHAGTHFAHGVLLQRSGDRQAALEAYRRATEINPRHAEALYALARLQHTYLKDRAAARATLQRVLEGGLRHAPARRFLGDLHRLEGKLEHALEHYRRALEYDPRDARTLYKAAFVHLKRDRPLEAMRFFERCLRVDPLMLDAHQQIARIWMNLGRPKEAAKELRKTFQKSPAYAMGYYDLGVLLERIGGGEAAVEFFEKFIALAPDHRLAAAVRRKLQDRRRSA